jgi:hypothetical protein
MMPAKIHTEILSGICLEVRAESHKIRQMLLSFSDDRAGSAGTTPRKKSAPPGVRDHLDQADRHPHGGTGATGTTRIQSFCQAGGTYGRENVL